ncbi:MAG: hypothetical protein FD152_3221 [Xanthobacteraceae bacterium]|nr:MAG: hypothetical protein FD152_3221 [Xanthobacteraceae bacterium]
MVRAASVMFSASSAILPSLMPTSQRMVSEAVTTVPPRMARSISSMTAVPGSSSEGARAGLPVAPHFGAVVKGRARPPPEN